MVGFFADFFTYIQPQSFLMVVKMAKGKQYSLIVSYVEWADQAFEEIFGGIWTGYEDLWILISPGP